MQTAQPSPLARDDTLLGVCQALGEDFGFNPIYLRLALGVLLLWNPVVVVAGYAAAALIIAGLRLIVPDRRRTAAASLAEASADAPAEGNDNADQEMLVAA